VHHVRVDGRDFVLVGTAHISRESAELVRRVIEEERPERVCLELDTNRYEALQHPQRFDSLDLKEIIRRRQLSTLILNVVLASYQSQLGGAVGVAPGAELLAAAEAARERNIPIELCDRDVRITLRRSWATLSPWKKLRLTAEFLALLVERPELSEEDLRELRRQDVVTKLMNELGTLFPPLKEVLIDERDVFLATKIRQAAGARIVAVVGAGHVNGTRDALVAGRPVDLDALETLPPPSRLIPWLGWGVPVVILGSIAAIGWREGSAAAWDNLVLWVLANGIPTMIGAFLAGGHVLTAAVGFLAAPMTSLTPVIGAGYVAAFAQAYLRPPSVAELRSVTSDFAHVPRWWRNRLLRVFLVFVLTTLGSALGTVVAGSKILSDLF
jgi:pheromone shutdown-related protein TraB